MLSWGNVSVDDLIMVWFIHSLHLYFIAQMVPLCMSALFVSHLSPQVVTLPFTFTFYGHNVTKAYIATGGELSTLVRHRIEGSTWQGPDWLYCVNMYSKCLKSSFNLFPIFRNFRRECESIQQDYCFYFTCKCWAGLILFLTYYLWIFYCVFCRLLISRSIFSWVDISDAVCGPTDG